MLGKPLIYLSTKINMHKMERKNLFLSENAVINLNTHRNTSPENSTKIASVKLVSTNLPYNILCQSNDAIMLSIYCYYNAVMLWWCWSIDLEAAVQMLNKELKAVGFLRNFVASIFTNITKPQGILLIFLTV